MSDNQVSQFSGYKLYNLVLVLVKVNANRQINHIYKFNRVIRKRLNNHLN